MAVNDVHEKRLISSSLDVTMMNMVRIQENMMVKIKWQVAEAPTGRYRSFYKRGWPTARYKDTDRPALYIECEDSYVPANVKTGNHKELVVLVADYSVEQGTFQWRRLKARFKTLDEAKAAGERFLNAHPEMQPK
jgi:hypothetical protein